MVADHNLLCICGGRSNYGSFGDKKACHKEEKEMNCSICLKEFTAEDIEQDRITKIQNIPGQVHKKCKAEFDIQIVGTGRVTENLEKKKDELL